MATGHDVAVVQQDNTALMKRPEHIATAVPRADIYETPDAYIIKLDMPGATKESISVTMDKNSLVIRGDVNYGHDVSAKVLYNEMAGVAFHRSFNLTDTVDRNSVDARFEDGVLTLKLLKREELKARRIQIQ